MNFRKFQNTKKLMDLQMVSSIEDYFESLQNC